MLGLRAPIDVAHGDGRQPLEGGGRRLLRGGHDGVARADLAGARAQLGGVAVGPPAPLHLGEAAHEKTMTRAGRAEGEGEARVRAAARTPGLKPARIAARADRVPGAVGGGVVLDGDANPRAHVVTAPGRRDPHAERAAAVTADVDRRAGLVAGDLADDGLASRCADGEARDEQDEEGGWDAHKRARVHPGWHRQIARLPEPRLSAVARLRARVLQGATTTRAARALSA